MKTLAATRTLGAVIALCIISAPSHGQTPEGHLGEVRTFAATFCPRGFAPLNGKLLPINQNQALFSLLGTRYGGDGRVTFALPTAKPLYTATRVPLLQCIALQGIFPSRN